MTFNLLRSNIEKNKRRSVKTKIVRPMHCNTKQQHKVMSFVCITAWYHQYHHTTVVLPTVIYRTRFWYGTIHTVFSSFSSSLSLSVSCHIFKLRRGYTGRPLSRLSQAFHFFTVFIIFHPSLKQQVTSFVSILQ